MAKIAYPYDAELDLQRLLLDSSNPRLPQPARSQRQALIRLAEQRPSQFVALAEHVALHGLNPSERLVVSPKGKDFVVHDGNRRFAALKALDSPDALVTLSKAQRAKLKSAAAVARIPSTLKCVVFKNREQAEEWIRVMHIAPTGVGRSKWTAQQRAREDARTGGVSHPLQVLEFVVGGGQLSDDAADVARSGEFKMSILERLIESKDVRPKLGISIRADKLTIKKEDWVLAAWTRIAEDIVAKRVNNRDLNEAQQRVGYVDSVLAAVAASPGSSDEDSSSDASATKPSPKGKKAKGARPAKSTDRKYLVPSDFDLDIPVPRVLDIFNELKHSIVVAEAPNAAGALLRMFVELSLWSYCKRTRGLKAAESDRLKENWKAVRAHIESKSLLERPRLNAIQKHMIDNTTGLVTVQMVIHNPDKTAQPGELNALWDQFAPLFEILWPPR